MVDPADQERALRSHRSRMNALRGDHTQEVVGQRLRALGLHQVQRIETGWTPIRAFDVRRKRTFIIGATPNARVHADWTAVCPGGRSVRCEVKARRDGQLSLVDFEAHQAAALTEHAELGGLSLVAWVHGRGVELLVWPVAGLVKGEPLNAEGDPRVAAARWPGLG